MRLGKHPWGRETVSDALYDALLAAGLEPPRDTPGRPEYLAPLLFPGFAEGLQVDWKDGRPHRLTATPFAKEVWRMADDAKECMERRLRATFGDEEFFATAKAMQGNGPVWPCPCTRHTGSCYCGRCDATEKA